ncbi:MAG: ATP-binding cassette domain-containing protein, partial [Alphaproteobacteria bacterium]
GYFAQHQVDELNEDGTAYSHMAELMPDAKEAAIRARLGPIGFEGDKALTRVSALSGGEKARLTLALIAATDPAVLVLDEPTNHLDIDSREALIQALNAYDGAVIVISHDRHFLEATVDRLWLVADGTVTPFDGDLEDYEKLVLAESRNGNAKVKKGPSRTHADDRRRAADVRARLAPLKQEAEAAERLVVELERERARITKALSSPLLYENTDDAKRKLAALTEMEGRLAQRVEDAEAEWLAAQERYDAALAESGASA